jgi:aryl-phospho-beta-D-glucosidase BglC (GH1 family)
MEGYILGGRNIAESEFKRSFLKIYGKRELGRFESLFRDNFITEEDFKNISSLGANTIRLPFNHKLIETKPFVYSKDWLAYLRKALTLAKKYNLGVILDLHAAPGAQNCDWHSDSDGTARFWQKEEFRKRTLKLWEFIVTQLKDEPALIAYDVINEPVLDEEQIEILYDFYREAIKRIQVIDKTHTIFLEGNIWAQQIEFLKGLITENVSISIHTYQPINYTFNFRPFYSFGHQIEGEAWDKEKIKKYLEPYFIFSQKNNVRIYVGEFGINWRGGYFGELDWLNSMLNAFEEFNFDYTYWTYKAIAGYVFPDGIYQHIADNKYINRSGPVYGWENYLKYWGEGNQQIVDFWLTKNYTPNKEIISLLEKFFRQRGK